MCELNHYYIELDDVLTRTPESHYESGSNVLTNLLIFCLGRLLVSLSRWSMRGFRRAEGGGGREGGGGVEGILGRRHPASGQCEVWRH